MSCAQHRAAAIEKGFADAHRRAQYSDPYETTSLGTIYQDQCDR